MNNKSSMGVIGMAVMGSNLALNMSKNGYLVSIYNRSSEKTKLVISNNRKSSLLPFYNIKDFINSINMPRKIFLMVKSGKSTDDIINLIIPLLNKNDIIIDAGNSFYKDTIRRNHQLSKKDIIFIGMGISGGEEGALNGPSIMPGGDEKAYKLLYPILKKIAAKANDNTPCVNYIGPDGSGHYIKMIHNGIEYGDMQLISESYFLLKNLLNMKNDEISKIFNQWNKSELNSYLIEITIDILKKKNNKGEYILDNILDEASNKGTGKWTSQEALDLGEPLSLITESVFARYISNLKNQRLVASRILQGPESKKIIDVNNFIEEIRRALYLGKIISYSQGFSQIYSASKKNNWNLNCCNIAKIFRSGCIIRAKFLNKIIEAYENNKKLNNIIISPYFKNICNKYQYSLRNVVSNAVISGIPIPAFSSAISYYDSYRSSELPANLIQAQRDYFGSHMYKIKNENNKLFHTNWKK